MSQLSISWSSLRAHEECHQKGMLLRTGKKNPTTDIRSYFHGTVVDRVMREFLSDPEPGSMPGMVVDIMRREELAALEKGDGVVRWKSATDKAKVTEFCIELVRRLEPLLYDLVIPYDYEDAKRFRVPINIPYLDGRPTQIYLAGEMDLLVRRPGVERTHEYDIWDLKGTADEGYWRKTIAQITFYDLATYSMFGQYSERAGLIQPMCKQQVIHAPVTDQNRAELMQRIINMAHDMWKKDWSPKESVTGCSYCAVRHACERFKAPDFHGSARVLALTDMKSFQSSHSAVSGLLEPTPET